MSYRPDIDGLRALAVLLVLFYHAGFDFVPGGYIGVDVFFVISGYLITSIIFRELQEERFSFKEFYLRRMKRILPAFYVIALATTFAGYFLLLPSDYMLLVQSVVAGIFFVANIFFLQSTGGYFSANAEELPMLHTWSLSVEEQFYFVWPLALMLLLRHLSRRWLVIVTLLLMIVSFFIAERGALNEDSSVYFLLPARVGEFLVGAILAFLPAFSRGHSKGLTSLLSLLGLLMIIVPALLLSADSTFPGINALWPCLGAALLIYSGASGETVGARLLSSRPALFFGAISYSLYLWHWPLVAFAVYLQYELTTLLGLTIVVLSTLLAWLSWKFVETPFRHTQRGFRAVFASYFALPSLVFIAWFSLSEITQGFVHRYKGSADFVQANEWLRYPDINSGWCNTALRHRRDMPFHEELLHCSIGNKRGELSALLWGDSHGGHYEPFVHELSKNENIKVNVLNAASCFPTIAMGDHGVSPDICNKFRDHAISMLRAGKVDLLVIAARWERMMTRGQLEEAKLAIKFSAQHARRVVILAQVPVFSTQVGELYRRATILPVSGRRVAVENEDFLRANRILSKYSDGIDNVDFIDTAKYFMRDGIYVSDDSDGKSLYIDQDHLSIEGSKALARRFSASADGRATLTAYRELLCRLEAGRG